LSLRGEIRGVSRLAAAFVLLAVAGCVSREVGGPERSGSPADAALLVNVWQEVEAYYNAANVMDSAQAEKLFARIRPKVDERQLLFTEALQSGTDDEKVIAAGALGFASSRKVVPHLVDALRSPLDAVRVHACLSLGTIADPSTPVDMVVGRLGDPSRVVRQTAGWTLSRLLRRGQGSAMLSESDVLDWPELCGKLVQAEAEERRRREEAEDRARKERAAAEKAKAAAAAAADSGAAPSPESQPGDKAASVPAEQRWNESVAATPGARILELMDKSERDTIRAAARSGDIDGGRRREVLAALNALLKRRDFLRRSVGGVAVSDEAKALLAARPRELAPKDVIRLNRLLLEAAFPEEIAKSGERGAALDALLKALEDEDPLVRNNAVVALRAVAAIEAVSPLVEKGLADNDWRVRLNAASALGKTGDKDAVEPLIQAMRDNQGNLYVLDAVKFGLREITGQDFGGSYTSWKNWWEDQKKPMPAMPGEEETQSSGTTVEGGYGATGPGPDNPFAPDSQK
jgi:HEAT repeat protein